MSRSSNQKLGLFYSFIMAVIVATIGGAMYGLPRYKVYKQAFKGEAAYREAVMSKKVIVEEARAQEEALAMRARGEAEREKIKADATAEAIGKIGEALEAAPAYLRWLWINEVAGSEGERIYIATEAGLPILEAGK